MQVVHVRVARPPSVFARIDESLQRQVDCNDLARAGIYTNIGRNPLEAADRLNTYFARGDRDFELARRVEVVDLVDGTDPVEPSAPGA